jgi:hypothetical protein
MTLGRKTPLTERKLGHKLGHKRGQNRSNEVETGPTPGGTMAEEFVLCSRTCRRIPRIRLVPARGLEPLTP